MKTTSIRELKHDTKKVLALVEAGETVEVTRYNQTVAILSPVQKSVIKRPDFTARLKEIYGDKVLPTTATQMISEERGDR